jgi:hypothetical protein
MRRLVIAGLAVFATVTAANAIDPRHPDWPCNQIMVPSLSVAAFWTSPPIEDVGDAWRKDAALEDLVQRLAARRTPIEEAEKTAGDFITGTPDEKQKKAALLFAGLFATLNGERTQVMDGIERFAKRQQELRTKIQTELTQMRQRQDAANQTNAAKPDEAAENALGEQIAWDTRLFDERRHTISYVCEVPGNIERRLGSLARAIQQTLE